jgi:hypothetical protein
MKKEKKRNKKYVPPRSRLPLRVDPVYLDGVRQILTDASLAVEMKLPQGNMSVEDVLKVQDCLNWIGFTLYRKTIPEEDAKSAAEMQRKAATAFCCMTERVGSGKTTRFVAKAEELDALRDFFEVMNPVMKELIDYSPVMSVIEFFASLFILRRLVLQEEGTEACEVKEVGSMYFQNPEVSLGKYHRTEPKIKTDYVSVVSSADWYDKSRYEAYGFPYPKYLLSDIHEGRWDAFVANRPDDIREELQKRTESMADRMLLMKAKHSKELPSEDEIKDLK